MFLSIAMVAPFLNNEICPDCLLRALGSLGLGVGIETHEDWKHHADALAGTTHPS